MMVKKGVFSENQNFMYLVSFGNLNPSKVTVPAYSCSNVPLYAGTDILTTLLDGSLKYLLFQDFLMQEKFDEFGIIFLR